MMRTLTLLLVVTTVLAIAVAGLADDTPTPANVPNFFDGDWRIVLLNRVSKETGQVLGEQVEAVPLTLKNVNGTVSGHFVDSDDEYVQVSLKFKDDQSGTFYVAAAVAADEDEFESGTATANRELFSFDFSHQAHQPSGLLSSHGKWMGGSGWFASDMGNAPAVYHLIAPSPLSFMLTITTDDQMIVYLGKKEPKPEQKTFFGQYGSSIMMFAIIIGLQFFKHYFSPAQPPAAAAAAGGAAPQGNARPTSGAGAVKAD